MESKSPKKVKNSLSKPSKLQKEDSMKLKRKLTKSRRISLISLEMRPLRLRRN